MGALSLEARRAALAGRVSFRELARVGWLSSDLIATPAAAARLRSWAEEGRPGPDIRRLVYQGDDEVGAVLRDVLRRLPPVLARFIIENVSIRGVGASSRGWAAPASRPRRVYEVVVDGSLEADDLAGVIVHEACHCWLGDVADRPPGEGEVEAQEQRRRQWALLACEAGRVDETVRAWARREMRTCRLVRALGFGGIGADVEGAARLARREFEEAATGAVLDRAAAVALAAPGGKEAAC